MDQIISSLRQSGQRLTPLKLKLIKLFKHSSSPLSVPQILSSIPANKTTIYREIKSLLQLGHLSQLDFGDGQKYYEFASVGHHHHLICLNCKNISEVKINDDFSSTEELIAKEKNFMITKHQLEFYGFCHNCS